MKNRREFLKISGAGALGMMAMNPLSAATAVPNRKKYGVGIQLYTIRDAIAKDLEVSLKKVSDIGYKYLELADYADGKFYGHTPKDFRKMAADLDMVVLSSHTKVEDAGINKDNAKKMADAHAELGVKYCVQPWVNPEDRNIERYKQLIEEWNKAGEIMKDVGIQFGYHNHNFEFKNINGIVPYYDLFLKEMDKDLVTMEIDLYWVSKAGQDPVEMFKQYPGRFQLFHMKDKAYESPATFDVQKDDITSVGEGVIDFRRILTAKETAGMKYMFVEDDNQGNGKPFKGIETSLKNLTTKIL